MKGKIFKTITAILILMALTMTNFIYVGVGLVSYAESNVATNNQNVEFGAQINNGKLNLELSVKKDGYFNGTIELSDSNFKLKSSNSEYINQVEDNKITLNQINAGTTAKMEIEIEPVQKDVFNAGLLNMTSKLQLSGIYKNSSDKENTVKATREVAYKYTANSSQENVENSAQIITNKIVKISGEEKRVVEISMNMGLKDNYNVEATNEQSSFESRLQRVLDDRGEYVSSVIGNKLKNVELHKYYKYLMKTAFRGKKIDIKPIDKNYLEGIQYVLIARQSDECPEDICYLYDKEQGKFVKTSMEDILEKKKREEQKEKSGKEGIELDID